MVPSARITLVIALCSFVYERTESSWSSKGLYERSTRLVLGRQICPPERLR
jgi:hypothetical protein